jgi:hypothetical protein
MYYPRLPWTTRGVKHPTREYLAEITMDLEELQQQAPVRDAPFGLSPDTYLTDAIPLMQRLRAEHRYEGPAGIEYGCFNHDGTLIEDPGVRLQRQIRNILYYVIRDVSNLRRGYDQHSSGPPPDAPDPVPASPEGQWAVLLTESCPHDGEVEQALGPLVAHRGGEVIRIANMDPAHFVQGWLQPRFNDGSLPRYLLICDTFENFPIEFQFILNAVGVTGRVWFPDVSDLQAYVDKVLRLERAPGRTADGSTVASPVDDSVTFADRMNIIDPILSSPDAAGLHLRPLLGADFSKPRLLEQASTSRFLALYCHGLGLTRAEWEVRSELHGSFVLRFETQLDEDLLTPGEVADCDFVPGGIIFTPACMGGGTVTNSDYCAWVDPRGLADYMGGRTEISAISRAMLASPEGPAAVVAHFDVSMAGSAPMYNPMSQEYDLQRLLHGQFFRHLAEGATVGSATNPFRWAAGAYYAQAIYVFGQLTGSNSYLGTSGVRKTVGMAVNSMNQYHVIATDMRNFLILGDPAVRLEPKPNS